MSKIVYMLSFLTLILSNITQGSTFVGNGGSWLDAELRETIHKVKEVLLLIQEKEDIEECDRSICDILEGLSNDEHRFATKFFMKRRMSIIRAINSKKLEFKWTSSEIRIKGSSSRTFSAIADGTTITINENVFARLNLMQRMSLIIHEINHLIRFDGKVINDNRPIGPFEGSQGGRKLLDLQGVMLIAGGTRYGYFRQKDHNLSNPNEKLNVQQSIGSTKISNSEGKRLFFNKLKLSSTSVEYFPWENNSVGFHLTYKSYKGKSNQLVYSVFESGSLSVGVSSRYRLSSLIMNKSSIERNLDSSYLDRIYFKGHLNIGKGTAVHLVGDGYSQIEGRDSFFCIGGDINLYLPIVYGFWFNLGYGLQWQEFTIQETNFTSKSVYNETNVGVSYGFSI